MYTVIETSKEQAYKFLIKHLTNTIPFIPAIHSITCVSEAQGKTSYIRFKTHTNKEVNYQFRSGKAIFVELTGFNTIRYDISYPEELCPEMSELLNKIGAEAEQRFWEGAAI